MDLNDIGTFKNRLIMNSNSFRLLSLKINDKLFNGEEIRLCKDNSSTSDNYYSLIIGNNGSGKSRILSNIARYFQDRQKSGQSLLWNDFNYTQLPERIITISSSISDKFPVDKTYRTFDQFEVEYRNLDYIYLGTRNRANSYSTKALLNRAISIMFESYVDELVAANYRHIFDYLNYEPVIKIEYKLALSNIKDKNGEITKSSLSEYFKTNADKERYDSRYFNKFNVDSILFNKCNVDDMLSEIINLLNEISSKNTYEIDINFSERGIQRINSNPDTYKNDYKIFKLLLTLQKLRIVRNSEIKLAKNGGEFSFSEASSGEANVLSTLIALIPLVKNNSLILIDEPEISLHPFWQQKYIDLLKNIFSHVKGCHIIIASHSPFLASDLPQNCSAVVSLIDAKGKIVCKLIEESTFGWSTENVLLNVFNVPFVRNYYLSQLLSEALELLGEYKRDENRLNEIKAKIRDLNPNIKSEDPLKKVIELILNNVVDYD